MPIPEITELQKTIYNIYLKYLAQKSNRPFSYRKNFDKIKDDDIINLSKLELFFKRNPEINIDLYFKAGFKYSSDTFLSLGYFYNFIVIKQYNKLEKERSNYFIDSKEAIDDFLEGLRFVLTFVKTNNITFNDYKNFKNDSGINWFLIHLKMHNISLYHLHFFNISLHNFYDDEILNIYLEDFRTKFFKTKREYTLSKKLKLIADKVNNLIK